jgi:hypothetical protein
MGYITVDRSDICVENFLKEVEKLVHKNYINQIGVDALKRVQKELSSSKYKTFLDRFDAVNEVLKLANKSHERTLTPLNSILKDYSFTTKHLEMAQKLAKRSFKYNFKHIKEDAWDLYHNNAKDKDDFDVLAMYVGDLKDHLNIAIHLSKKEFKQAYNCLDGLDSASRDLVQTEVSNYIERQAELSVKTKKSTKLKI